ncbi:MAG TPA: AmmeMemoRadiSam system protein B [Bacteroidota bacterium]
MSASASLSSIREPAVAGAFYPASARTLQRDVDELLDKAAPAKPAGRVFGVVSPHAGYVYSGFTAAHAYRALKGMTFDAVIVVGPSHQEYFRGISVYSGRGYRTPLGTVPVNDSLRSAIVQEEKRIVCSDAGHRGEHSVEVQLPFLQRVLGEFSFVPVVMGDQTADLCENLAEALAGAVSGNNVLLVASSDLSHYHPYAEATLLDNRVVDLVELFEPAALMEKLKHRELEACGGGPIVAVMLAARKLGAMSARVVHHCNSGDITGEKDAVVGYLAAILSNNPPDHPRKVN